MDENAEEQSCIICETHTEEQLRTCVSGIPQLQKYATLCENDRLKAALAEQSVEVKVHPSCQKTVSNAIRKRKSDMKNEKGVKVAKLTRNSVETFIFEEHCFFCGEKCQLFDSKHPDRRKALKVTLIPYRDTILDICAARNDDWAQKVRSRVLPCIDLVQANAKYHDDCRKTFTGKFGPLPQAGRPQSQEKQKHFEAICDWLEADGDLHSIGELHDRMKEIADSEDVYHRKYFKEKLQERYGPSLFFAEVEGRSDVVMFRNACDTLINDEWYTRREEKNEEEAKRIIKQAAKLILGELKSTVFDTTQYPSHEMIKDIEFGKSWVPSYLRLLMETLIKNDLKQASIGQAIVSASRPRSCISPILFGLGVDSEKVFGSRWLLTELSRLGFSVSYDEVRRFKRNVVKNESITEYIKTNLVGKFGQWSGDNADHDFCTLDGKRTLHGMGLVFSSTPQNNATRLKPIPREKIESGTDITSNSRIPILQYQPPDESGLSSIKLKPIIQLNMANVLPEGIIYDSILHALHFHPMLQPSWSGYMSKVCTGTYPGQSSVSLLPIIDLNPNDMSCVYSTLMFVKSQSEILGIDTPVITFDQPLWIKAYEIIKGKSLNMVCMLGGFHLLMSFMGSIGSLMKSSGLEESMEQIYAKNTVPHIISGKAIARALRAYFLVESALVCKLMSPLVGPNDEAVEIEDLTTDLNVIANADDPTIDLDMSRYPTLSKLLELLEKYKDDLKTCSRTAKLWLQYLDYMEVVKDFTRSERTGDWNLYLFTLSRMINLFAATAHIHYAKSARLHLQNMLELKTTHPWVYKQFSNGYHTVRRSDKFWAGLWSDLIIEQVMMRSIKSNGGLTRGRGIAESTSQLWIGSIHRSADIHNAMSALTGACRKTSEQHVNLSLSRMTRDDKDFATVKDWFDNHEPFDKAEPELKSLSSGLIAGPEINCDDAEKVGRGIQKKQDNVGFEEVKIRRKEKAKTFEDMIPAIKIGDSKVIISPTILFSRLTALGNFTENVGENFCYELTPEPTSLFKLGMMRKPQKSNLRNHFINKANACQLESHDVCIVDGGALLHKVSWPKTTYSAVIDEYVNFLKNNFQCYSTVVIVFDGYEDEMSTKGQEHNRRSGKTSASVSISLDGKVTTNRELFLSNPSNKVQLIKLLSSAFEKQGFLTDQSDGDADVLIVERGLSYAKAGRNVVITADDTDIFILMMYHWKVGMGEMFFSTDKIGDQKNKAKVKPKLFYWKISQISATYDHCDMLLFAHAWSGCDTTSAIHQKGIKFFSI